MVLEIARFSKKEYNRTYHSNRYFSMHCLCLTLNHTWISKIYRWHHKSWIWPEKKTARESEFLHAVFELKCDRGFILDSNTWSRALFLSHFCLHCLVLCFIVLAASGGLFQRWVWQFIGICCRGWRGVDVGMWRAAFAGAGALIWLRGGFSLSGWRWRVGMQWAAGQLLCSRLCGLCRAGVSLAIYWLFVAVADAAAIWLPTSCLSVRSRTSFELSSTVRWITASMPTSLETFLSSVRCLGDFTILILLIGMKILYWWQL